MPNGDGSGPYDAELHEARVTAKVFASLCIHLEGRGLMAEAPEVAQEWWLRYKRKAEAEKQRQRKHDTAEAEHLRRESARLLRDAAKLEAGGGDE